SRSSGCSAPGTWSRATRRPPWLVEACKHARRRSRRASHGRTLGRTRSRAAPRAGVRARAPEGSAFGGPWPPATAQRMAMRGVALVDDERGPRARRRRASLRPGLERPDARRRRRADALRRPGVARAALGRFTCTHKAFTTCPHPETHDPGHGEKSVTV